MWAEVCLLSSNTDKCQHRPSCAPQPSREKCYSQNGLTVFQPGAHLPHGPCAGWTLQTSCQRGADGLLGGSLRERYYFCNHSAWCILTGCTDPGSPDRTPALGFANPEKQPGQVCNPRPFLHTQLTVFSPPVHHWCCCCPGITWKVSPWSLSPLPGLQLDDGEGGAMRQPLLCSSSRHCCEQEAWERPWQPRHRVTSAGADAALLPSTSTLSSRPTAAPFVPSPCLTFTNFPGERTRCVSASSSNMSVLLAKAPDPGHLKGHCFWPQSLSTFLGDDDFTSFSTERTGSSVFPLASLAHLLLITHIPIFPPQDTFLPSQDTPGRERTVPSLWAWFYRLHFNFPTTTRLGWWQCGETHSTLYGKPSGNRCQRPF